MPADLLLRCGVLNIDGLPDHMVFHTALKVDGIAPVDQVDAAVAAQKAVDGTDIAVDIASGMGLL